MFKMFVFFARKPELSPEAFLDYYENHHVPLLLSIVSPPPVYKRNYLKRDDSLKSPGEALTFDVVAEQVFADRKAFDAWLAVLYAPDTAARVHEDEERFLDSSRTLVYVVEERVTANTPPL